MSPEMTSGTTAKPTAMRVKIATGAYRASNDGPPHPTRRDSGPSPRAFKLVRAYRWIIAPPLPGAKVIHCVPMRWEVMLAMPGIVIHELGHYLLCRLCGA